VTYKDEMELKWPHTKSRTMEQSCVEEVDGSDIILADRIQLKVIEQQEDD